MDIIAKARELGKLMQQDARYTNLMEATEKTENDTELQDNINKFNDVRTQISLESAKPERDAEKLEELNIEFRKVYTEIVASQTMQAYNSAKAGMEEMLSQINAVVMGAANGQNPDEIDENAAGCGGDCSGCGGGCGCGQ